ncbi:MAG TPA: hypothetical protein VJ785_14270 [Anaerolineales bacterium]|nr:hypothetical protein [Anaerolineales bacterium]
MSGTKNHKLTKKIDVYLEVGSRRTFAAALDWPGWCRLGRDEDTALQTLLEYGPRYARILRPARLGFKVPEDVSAFVVTEQLKGNATTDFGAPDMAPPSDAGPLDDTELRRLQAILKACWRAFDAAVDQARGMTLRKGPRGGGRSLNGIAEHVLGAEMGYLSQLGGKVSQSKSSPPTAASIRKAILKTLKASAHGEVAEYGPRGGRRWSPRYFVRRESWHILDHVWEIEDRLMEPEE